MRVSRLSSSIRQGSRPELLIWGGCLVLLALIAGLGHWTLLRDYQDRQHTVSVRTQILASAVAGYTATAVQQRRLSLDALAYHVGGLSWPLDGQQIDNELARFVDADPQRNPMLVIDGTRRWSLPAVEPRALERFGSMPLGDSIGFGDPVELEGQTWLPLLRRYHHPGGDCVTVGVLMPLATLQTYLDSLDLPKDLPIALLDPHGHAVIQHGQDQHPALSAGEEGVEQAVEGASPHPLVVRRSVPGFPLQVVVARWPDEYLANWYEQKSLTLSTMLLASLVILGLAASLVSAWRLLARSERRYRQLFQSINDGVLLVGRFGVMEANARAAALFGTSCGAALEAQRLVDLCAPFQADNRPARVWLAQLLNEVQRGSELFTTLQFRRLDCDEHFVCEVHLSPIRFKRTVYLLVCMHDISARQRVEHDLATANSRLQRLSAQVIEVQERERHHLARELHDDVGQLLTFIKISAAGVQRHLSGEQEQRQAALVHIAEEALGRVRDLSRMLRPAQLDGLGLVAAMRWQVENYLPPTQDGLMVRLELAELQPRPDPCVEITLFRIFQEALSNVLKHAGASLLEVSLKRCDGRIELRIVDNGRGFDVPAALKNDRGMGLFSMAERAKLIEGEFRLNSRQGSGTQIGVGIPEHDRKLGCGLE